MKSMSIGSKGLGVTSGGVRRLQLSFCADSANFRFTAEMKVNG